MVNGQSQRASTAGADWTSDRVFGAATEFVLTLREHLAWHENAIYLGHSLNYKEEGWLLVVRASRKNQRVVAFFAGESEIACWRALWYDSTRRPGVNWALDRFSAGGRK